MASCCGSLWRYSTSPAPHTTISIIAVPSDCTAPLKINCPRKAGYEVVVSYHASCDGIEFSVTSPTMTTVAAPIASRNFTGRSPRRSFTMKITTAPIIRTMFRIVSTEPAAAFFERSSRYERCHASGTLSCCE